MFVQSPPIAHRLGVEAGLSSVGGKPWADDACLAGLVRAIDDLLQPQAYLCRTHLELSIDMESRLLKKIYNLVT